MEHLKILLHKELGPAEIDSDLILKVLQYNFLLFKNITSYLRYSTTTELHHAINSTRRCVQVNLMHIILNSLKE